MGEDVALFHHGQHVIEAVAPGVLGVDHNGQTGGIRSLAGPVQGQHPRALADDAVAGEPHLDPQDEIAVLFDHAAGFAHICVLGDLELADFVRQHALRGDIELGQDAGGADVDDELAEAGKSVGSGRASIDCGSDASGQAGGIRLDAKMADPPEHVDVQVDEARGHHVARDIERLACLGCGQVGPDCGYLTVGEGHVQHRVQLLGWID